MGFDTKLQSQVAYVLFRLVSRFFQDFLAVRHLQEFIERGFRMRFHVALHNLEADEDADAAGRVVAEVAGEGCFVDHAADNVVGIVIDHVLFDEFVPDG